MILFKRHMYIYLISCYSVPERCILRNHAYHKEKSGLKTKNIIMKKVSVMVVNDGDIIQPKIRSFLSDFVFKEKNFVMHEACNFRQAVDKAKTLKPDMIMLDGNSFANEGYKRGDVIVADLVNQSTKSIIIMFNSKGELAEKAIQNGAHITIDNMKEKEGQQIKNLISLLIK